MEESTIFFGRVAGPYLLVTGLGLLLSTDYYLKMVRGSGSMDPVALNLSGAVHFLVGLAMVVRHFRFGSAPETIVTLSGIAALLKGSLLIAVPEQALQLPRTGKTVMRVSGLAFLAVGAYLGGVSYF